MLTFFIIISILEFILLLVGGYLLRRSVQLLFETLSIVETLRDRVDESLDTLDSSYRRIEEISGYDVISDEPFVKRVVETIHEARDSVHKVAVMIASSFIEEEESDDKENEKREGKDTSTG